jgi:hypothetical protein
MFIKKYSFSHQIEEYIKKHSNLAFVILFLSLWLLCSTVFYLRFPQSFHYANFFAEDGSVFLNNYMHEGIFKSMFIPFNGYFISGLYLCVFIADIINRILFSGELITLAKSFALTSYLLLGLCAASVLVLYRFLGLLTCTVIALLITTLPLPNTTHQLIGTIGNLKWIFFFLAYIATLFWIIYRHKLSMKRAVALSIVLLTCIYTNAYSYLALGILTVVYLWDIFTELQQKRQKYKTVLINFAKHPTIQLLIITGLLATFQLIFVKIHGIPVIPGYLNTPFDWSRGIEIIGGRTLLFELVFRIWGHLSDWIVVVLSISFFASGFYFLQDTRLYIFVSSFIVSITATLLFIATRPGISGEFHGYGSTGPDHFFYAQNLIMYIPFVLIITALCTKIIKNNKFSQGATLVILVVLLLVNITHRDFISRNNLMESMTGTLGQNILKQCKTINQGVLTLPLYPIGIGFILTVDQSNCKDINKTIHSAIDNISNPINTSKALTIGKEIEFKQTFVAQHEDLDGIKIILSTYGQKSYVNTYQLLLMDETCSKVFSRSEVGKELFDNYPYIIHFPVLPDSYGKKYCFTLQETHSKTNAMLAIRESTIDSYSNGEFYIKNKKQTTDLTFWPTYNEYR